MLKELLVSTRMVDKNAHVLLVLFWMDETRRPYKCIEKFLVSQNPSPISILEVLERSCCIFLDINVEFSFT